MSTILLVDDNKEIRDLLSATLELKEHTIMHAATGSEAVDIAREHRPDLSLMDIAMPGGMDGVEATRKIMEDESTRSCRDIVLSGTERPEKLELGLKAGASHYLTKPFSPLELIELVETTLKFGRAAGAQRA